jgi:hypothetical protein
MLTDQEVLTTYASIILRHDPVRMFGRRRPSREFRQIPKAAYENLFVGPDATTLQRAVLPKEPIYTDVAILARDYRKHVAVIQLDPAEWPIPPARLTLCHILAWPYRRGHESTTSPTTTRLRLQDRAHRQPANRLGH